MGALCWGVGGNSGEKKLDGWQHFGPRVRGGQGGSCSVTVGKQGTREGLQKVGGNTPTQGQTRGEKKTQRKTKKIWVRGSLAEGGTKGHGTSRKIWESQLRWRICCSSRRSSLPKEFSKWTGPTMGRECRTGEEPFRKSVLGGIKNAIKNGLGNNNKP